MLSGSLLGDRHSPFLRSVDSLRTIRESGGWRKVRAAQSTTVANGDRGQP